MTFLMIFKNYLNIFLRATIFVFLTFPFVPSAIICFCNFCKTWFMHNGCRITYCYIRFDEFSLYSIELYIGIATSKLLAVSMEKLFIWVVHLINDAHFPRKATCYSNITIWMVTKTWFYGHCFKFNAIFVLIFSWLTIYDIQFLVVKLDGLLLESSNKFIIFLFSIFTHTSLFKINTYF